MTFNPRDNWVYAIAVKLRNLFENTWYHTLLLGAFRSFLLLFFSLLFFFSSLCFPFFSF